MTPGKFRTVVQTYGKVHGRHALPWRSARTTPYGVLVSEVMLQQTQVERVIPYYQAFLWRFPSARALARAPLAEVLVAWQGLGYNRRAKLLHDTARQIVEQYGGRVPRDSAVLETLPGIGPYTARAIAAFTYNEDTVFIETNLRTAVIHHFFPEREKVGDAELLDILAAALPHGHAREWYAALMDYGASLKRAGIKLNARSTTYTKQSTFKGSLREARGAILARLAKGKEREELLLIVLGPKRRTQVKHALAGLEKDGLVERSGSSFRLPEAYRASAARPRARKGVSRSR